MKVQSSKVKSEKSSRARSPRSREQHDDPRQIEIYLSEIVTFKLCSANFIIFTIIMASMSSRTALIRAACSRRSGTVVSGRSIWNRQLMIVEETETPPRPHSNRNVGTPVYTRKPSLGMEAPFSRPAHIEKGAPFSTSSSLSLKIQRTPNRSDTN
jgi:hypothetical protein